ncbi:AAA family ATPase [uncultured Eubacterium sp.]|uniref:AAA family ATPase n=1 Tax=uncultured Eubacterium sp. TaxID=165185 RepID=UPI00326483E1
MLIKLISLHIENFKGIRNLDVNFSDKTSIKGQNASGKTTIFDAFTWLLFNKNCAGEEKFNVRPLDKDGRKIDNVEIKVVAILEVDGKEVEFSKVQKQNWVKKRGTDTVTLAGNPNLYGIDGYPKSETDFKAYVSELAQSEDMFKMLTNPQYFSSLKWKDQRDILMKLVAEVSDVEMAQSDIKYAPLLDELGKAPSTDDIRAKFQKALTEWKKKQAEIPVRIDEAEKAKVDVDVAEQELAKADLERKIEAVDKKIVEANAGNVLGDLRQQEMKLQFEMSGIAQSMNMELKEAKRAIESSIAECADKFTELHKTISEKEASVQVNKNNIAKADDERKKLGEAYKTEFAKVFDASAYQFDESKWVFDDSTTVCSLCGQKLPDDKIKKLKIEFEERKTNARADAEKKLSNAKNNFAAQKNSNLEEIKSRGFNRKNLIEELEKKNADLEVEIADLREQEQKAFKAKREAENKLADMPAEADYMQNKKYADLYNSRTEILRQIESRQASDEKDVIASLEYEKSDLKCQLSEVEKVIAQAAKNVEIDERISQLQTEQKEIGQKVADQEQMIYLLEDFIRFKLNKVSEFINSHFKTVKFKLFEMQLNGGMKDCCECTVNGIPYSALNSGHRIIAGLDIISSLSELYGLSVPIFVDNAESLNEFNVPDMDAQLILLSVSEDKQLKVEDM